MKNHKFIIKKSEENKIINLKLKNSYKKDRKDKIETKINKGSNYYLKLS